jgi:hypothetical protein
MLHQPRNMSKKMRARRRGGSSGPATGRRQPGVPAPVTSARTAAATAAAASGAALVHLRATVPWPVRPPTRPVDPCALVPGTNAHQERRMREPAGHAGPPTPGRSWLPPATRRQGRGAGADPWPHRARQRSRAVRHTDHRTEGGQGPLPAELPLPADLRVNRQHPHHRTLNQDRRVRVVTCWVHRHRMTSNLRVCAGGGPPIGAAPRRPLREPSTLTSHDSKDQFAARHDRRPLQQPPPAHPPPRPAEHPHISPEPCHPGSTPTGCQSTDQRQEGRINCPCSSRRTSPGVSSREQ